MMGQLNWGIVQLILSWLLLAQSYRCTKMGVMVDCDDGNWNWKKDAQTEGGIRHNSHCSSMEKEEFDETTLKAAKKWCEKNKNNLKAGEHRCMDKEITYENGTIPVSGRHRPVWPVYGEYRFVPPQRWIHNLEHGGLVFLYHPCAESEVVERLRSLVTGCLRRHIITPSRRLTPERPFALATWGCVLKFGTFTNEEIILWIRKNAIRKKGLQKAPEFPVHADGDYKHLLLKKAAVVSDEKDSDLCPTKKKKSNKNHKRSWE